jgi:hypothetical protein
MSIWLRPSHFADDLGMDAPLEQQRRGAVAEVVEPHLRQAARSSSG